MGKLYLHSFGVTVCPLRISEFEWQFVSHR